MSRQWKLTGLVLLGIYLFCFGYMTPATAQGETPPSETTCWRCHETEYQCREQGKWCCFSNPHRYCTDCHGGDDTLWDKKLAHKGMVNNPITENPAVCLDCHPDNSAEMIASFAGMSGLDLSITPAPTITPYPTLAVVSVKGNTPGASSILSWEPWRLAVVCLLVLVLVGLGIASLYCWRQDCLARRLKTKENNV